ncbi:hypothetical protein [Methylobacterium oryzisoli]|uniref:hypothetical protein n=1 Tax=Methylobacterium oryzisoli TaxID=3385502 RepID=UPI003891F2F9
MAEADIITPSFKACKKCGETKPFEAFWPEPKNNDGRRGTCSDCTNTGRRADADNSESRAKEAARKAEYRARVDPEVMRARKVRENARRAANEGREYLGREKRAERTARLKAEAVEQRKRQAATARADRMRERPWLDRSLTAGEWFALQYKADPEFNLKQRLRAAERRRCRGERIDDHMRDAIKRGGRSPKVERLLSYSIADLKRHLEMQFTKGMTWDRYFAGDIHIDHRRPLSSFDLSDQEQWQEAWALTNLQPLWRKDNLAKGAQVILLL